MKCKKVASQALFIAGLAFSITGFSQSSEVTKEKDLRKILSVVRDFTQLNRQDLEALVYLPQNKNMTTEEIAELKTLYRSIRIGYHMDISYSPLLDENYRWRDIHVLNPKGLNIVQVNSLLDVAEFDTSGSVMREALQKIKSSDASLYPDQQKRFDALKAELLL